MLSFGGVIGRVEFDQHIAGLDLWPSRTWIALTTPVSNGWISLVRPLGTILPGAVATMSTLPSDAQTSATQKTAMMVAADRAADRRGRRLDDLERRRQEATLVRRCRRFSGITLGNGDDRSC